MDAVDFFIGLTLMNAMPHFVLGIWRARMFSVFGFGDTKNILYGLLNFIISVGLFLYKHGLERLLVSGIYTGALLLLVIYFLTRQYWYSIFHRKYYENARKQWQGEMK